MTIRSRLWPNLTEKLSPPTVLRIFSLFLYQTAVLFNAQKIQPIWRASDMTYTVSRKIYLLPQFWEFSHYSFTKQHFSSMCNKGGGLIPGGRHVGFTWSFNCAATLENWIFQSCRTVSSLSVLLFGWNNFFKALFWFWSLWLNIFVSLASKDIKTKP